MPRHFHRKARLSALSELNVTPLIDLAFSLLIIFMVTTPLLEQSIPLQLPTQSKQVERVVQEPQVQTLSIDAKGAIAWGKISVDIEKLETILAQEASHLKDTVIHLRADASLPYQQVIQVLDLLKKYHLSKISLDTQAC